MFHEGGYNHGGRLVEPIATVHQNPPARRERLQDKVGRELQGGMAEGGLVHQDVHEAPELGGITLILQRPHHLL